MTKREQKLEFIRETYNDRLHADHQRCGELYCVDAGGAIVDDVPDEEVLQFYRDNKQEVDTQFNFEKKQCVETSKSPLTDELILGFFGGGKCTK